MKRTFGIFIVVALTVVLTAGTVWSFGTAGTTRSLLQSLFFALAHGDIETLAVVRDKGVDMNATLMEAGLDAETVFGDRISDLLTTDADLNTWPALTWAVYLQNEDMVRILLKSGAYPNAVDGNGTSPLHWAAWTGNYPIVKMLLANGANPYVADYSGRIPLDWAILTGQTDVIRLLPPKQPALDSDKDGVPDYMDQCPNTPLGAPVDERGCWVVAYGTYFDFDKSFVKEKYRPYIRRAAEILNQHPDLKVLIAGHTDSVGTQEYNMGLGQRRADAVRDLLVQYGVDAARLKTESFGESQPIATNATAQGRAKNRRVEIHIRQVN